jgi:uncharacterized phage-associated protein
MYSPLTIANTLVLRHPGRSLLGIAKIVYMVQGWTIAVGRPIVSELPQVWKYGPVHRDVYEAYNHFGHDLPTGPQRVKGGSTVPSVPVADVQALMDIASVVSMYSSMTDLELSSIAHAEGSPWKIMAEASNFQVSMGTVIPEAIIASHFGRLLASSQQGEAARLTA